MNITWWHRFSAPARLCAPISTLNPSESQNRVRVMSTTTVACPCLPASSRATRRSSAVMTSMSAGAMTMGGPPIISVGNLVSGIGSRLPRWAHDHPREPGGSARDRWRAGNPERRVGWLDNRGTESNPCNPRRPARDQAERVRRGINTHNQLGRCSVAEVVARCSPRLMTQRSGPVPGKVTSRPSVFQAGHIPSWHGSCECYALSPVGGVDHWSLLFLSPLVSAAISGPGGMTRLCLWCRNLIPARARDDAVCCSVRCIPGTDLVRCLRAAGGRAGP